MTFYLEVKRNGEWTLVGQYPTQRQAELIAADYRNHGEIVRITTDGLVTVTETPLEID